MKQSEQIGQLIEALALAKLDFQPILRSKRAGKEGEKFSYMYSPIENVLAAVTPALSANQLALIGDVELSADGVMALMTRLVHTSDQFIETTIPLGRITGDIKAIGSAITYGRRYGISTLLQVAADDDDDGDATESGQVVGRKGPKAVTRGPAPTTPAPEPLREPLSEAPKATPPKPTREDVTQLLASMRGVFPDEPTVQSKLRAVLQIPREHEYSDLRARTEMTWAHYEQLQDDTKAYAFAHAPDHEQSDGPEPLSRDRASPAPYDVMADDPPELIDVDAAGIVIPPWIERLMQRAQAHHRPLLVKSIEAEAATMTAGRYEYWWVEVADKATVKKS